MGTTRALVLALLVTASLVAVPLPAVASAPGSGAEHVDGVFSGPQSSAALALEGTYVGDDDDPSTNATIGYVEGVRYDDELPIDERADAVVEEDELERVVYRSMARVEVLRELPFEAPVSVDVITREEFKEETEGAFEEVTEENRLFENVRYEALFMVDRETDAVEEYETLYGDAVAGYYDPADDRIVLVSDSPEAPELDEVVLAHELLHALQDQHFDLQRFERETPDQATATDGLVEGDAVWVETAYEARCEGEWACINSSHAHGGELDDAPPRFNWGIYFTVYQPYSDGPGYVEYLLEEGGWEAVNAAYDDPPASSSEVIRPGEEREPVEIDVEDTSNEEWRQLVVENETVPTTFGEVALVSMLSHDALDRSTDDSVIALQEFIATDERGYIETIEYDQPYTDGWAGDAFVAYVTDAETIEESGYVWQTVWQSPDDAEQFAEGYLTLLGINGADPVDEHRDTFVIESAFPGAYHVDVDDETVTIVRAPSVDDLSEIHDGAAPAGEDNLDFEAYEFGNDVGGDGDGDGDGDDEIGGFGIVVGLVALLVVTALRRR